MAIWGGIFFFAVWSIACVKEIRKENEKKEKFARTHLYFFDQGVIFVFIVIRDIRAISKVSFFLFYYYVLFFANIWMRFHELGLSAQVDAHKRGVYLFKCHKKSHIMTRRIKEQLPPASIVVRSFWEKKSVESTI